MGLATTAHFAEIRRFQESFTTPAGPPDAVVARGLEEMTFPVAATDAQRVICPAIDFGSRALAVTELLASFFWVTERSRSCLLPTLPAGSAVAA